MKKNDLVNNIGFGIIIADLILIFAFQKNVKVVLFAVAFGLLVYGIMSIIKKSAIGYIITCLSISLAISGALYFTKYFDITKAFTFAISSSVFFIMILTIIFSIYKKMVIDKEFSLSIEAEVVELYSNPNTDAKFYQPCYGYTIDGHDYTVLFPAFINKNIPKIGEKRIIRVDKEDHQNVYFDKTTIEKVFDYLLLVFFLVISIIIMIGQFK